MAKTIGFNFEPSSPGLDWRQYFAEYRTQLDAFKVEHGIIDATDDEDEAEREPAFRVTVPGHIVPPADLPGSPKKLLQRLAQNPMWEAHAQHSATHIEPVLYVDSNRVRFEAKDAEHWQVAGVLTNDMRLGARINAHWLTVGGKTGFKGATVWDALTGQEVFYKQTGPLDVWLDVFAPLGKPEPKTPRKKKTTDKDLLTGEDWSSAA